MWGGRLSHWRGKASSKVHTNIQAVLSTGVYLSCKLCFRTINLNFLVKIEMCLFLNSVLQQEMKLKPLLYELGLISLGAFYGATKQLDSRKSELNASPLAGKLNEVLCHLFPSFTALWCLSQPFTCCSSHLMYSPML